MRGRSTADFNTSHRTARERSAPSRPSPGSPVRGIRVAAHRTLASARRSWRNQRAATCAIRRVNVPSRLHGGLLSDQCDSQDCSRTCFSPMLVSQISSAPRSSQSSQSRAMCTPASRSACKASSFSLTLDLVSPLALLLPSCFASRQLKPRDTTPRYRPVQILWWLPSGQSPT
jgi:hypothetical protein